MKVKSLSHVQLLVTPWTAAYQAPPSMGLSRQEYWSGVQLPSPICIHSVTHIHTPIEIYAICIIRYIIYIYFILLLLLSHFSCV